MEIRVDSKNVLYWRCLYWLPPCTSIAHGQRRDLLQFIKLGTRKQEYKICMNQDVFDEYYFKGIKIEILRDIANVM